MNRFAVRRSGRWTKPNAQVLEVGRNLFTGEQDFSSAFGQPTSMESDLLLIAAAVFAADRAVPRGEREDYARQFEIFVPVTNFATLFPLVQDIERTLYRLSNDSWIITLRNEAGAEEEWNGPTNPGVTLLFSGGLDSLAAAVEFGTEGSGLRLISHRTRNPVTAHCQNELLRLLGESGRDLPNHHVFVSSRSGGPTDLEHSEENSQRTRSFLFLILGALAARRAGHNELMYLAENGQMAIHLPLSTARLGAYSTHTAHPDVLQEMELFLATALSIPLHIQNPYVYRTKKEVVEVIAAGLPNGIAASNSCWRNTRLPAGVNHCGQCIPCFERRIAVESLHPDPTVYARDPWNEDYSQLDPADDARRNLADLTEFVAHFDGDTNEEIMSQWPELYSDTFDSSQVIAMYRRFAGEARNVLGRYPSLAPLLR